MVTTPTQTRAAPRAFDLTKVSGQGDAAVRALDGVAALAGVLAAVGPARRAARLDVLAAITHD